MKLRKITFGVISLIALLLSSSSAVQAFDDPPFVVQKVGHLGTGIGEFNTPISVDFIDGKYYVVERDNERVQVFDSSWNYLNQFGSTGSGNGNFDFPYSIAGNGTHLFVVDVNNDRIQIFTLDGNYVDQFGSLGTANGQFDFPINVMIFEDQILVSDFNNNRVQAFNMSTLEHIRNYGVSGSTDQMIDRPIGTVVAENILYVADRTNAVVKAYRIETGQYYGTFGEGGTGIGLLNGIWEIDFVNNHFVISDDTQDKISVYTKNGDFVYDIDYFINGATGFYLNETMIMTPEFVDNEISILKLVPDPENISYMIGSTAITVTWESVRNKGATPVEYYNIYRDQGDGLEYIGSADYNSFTDNSVSPDNNYTYAIEAISLIGRSEMIISSTVAFGDESGSSTVTETIENTVTEDFFSELPAPILPLFSSLVLIPIIRKKRD